MKILKSFKDVEGRSIDFQLAKKAEKAKYHKIYKLQENERY